MISRYCSISNIVSLFLFCVLSVAGAVRSVSHIPSSSCRLLAHYPHLQHRRLRPRQVAPTVACLADQLVLSHPHLTSGLRSRHRGNTHARPTLLHALAHPAYGQLCPPPVRTRGACRISLHGLVPTVRLAAVCHFFVRRAPSHDRLLCRALPRKTRVVHFAGWRQPSSHELGHDRVGVYRHRDTRSSASLCLSSGVLYHVRRVFRRLLGRGSQSHSVSGRARLEPSGQVGRSSRYPRLRCHTTHCLYLLHGVPATSIHFPPNTLVFFVRIVCLYAPIPRRAFSHLYYWTIFLKLWVYDLPLYIYIMNWPRGRVHIV